MKRIQDGIPQPVAAAATSLVLFAVLAAAMRTGATDSVDALLRDGVHSWASPSVTAFMAAITHLGSAAVLAPLSVAAWAILAATGRRRAAWLLVWIMAGSVILENGLKLAFHRIRPEPFFGLAAPETYSFPSGHALFSACFYGAVASILAARAGSGPARIAIWTMAIGLIAAIGLSRIYLGVHCPTDVIGGLLAAAFWIATVRGYEGYDR